MALRLWHLDEHFWSYAGALTPCEALVAHFGPYQDRRLEEEQLWDLYSAAFRCYWLSGMGCVPLASPAGAALSLGLDPAPAAAVPLWREVLDDELVLAPHHHRHAVAVHHTLQHGAWKGGNSVRT